VIRASIVIPALNEAENLSRNLPLVRQQMGPSDELIVVDNGSNDDTSALAKKHCTEVVWEPTRGRSQARNAGIKRSRGDIVVFLDADCHPASDWLNVLVAGFEDSAIGAVAGEISVSHGENDLGRYLARKGHLTQEANFKHPFLPFGGSANIAFRRSVLNRIGLFDTNLFSGHDADLCWRMQLETDFKIVRAPAAVVYHSQRLTPRDLIRQKRRHGHGSVLLFKKYRRFRAKESRPLKTVYWEYRSILVRAARSVSQKNGKAKDLRTPVDLDEGFQLLLEIGEKIGRLEGSVRHCIWFP
jgi:cellulose synthase/poly-beta-1,6-N-acetylglucosamine synthase-like glycosyltransferase